VPDGLPLPLEIQHDEFTTDIPGNRILRTHASGCSPFRVDAQSQRMLRRLLRDFSDITPLHRGEQIPGWQATRLNARYHAALRLAELVRGSAVAVIDAKYKAEKPAGYPNADLYQLLAYCTILGLRSGHLVYAKGNEKPVLHVLCRSASRFSVMALILSREPDAN
jgi:5-methylcytosine-specific restriction endonuclease McrBC regulatory subunit McrC